MNELSIKQKAKLYDEALERARALNNGEDANVEAGTTICEYIFPELKESEDEKTRKEIIAEVKEQIDCIPAPDCRDKEDEKALKQLNKWLAWLEKQGQTFTQKDVDDAYLKGICDAKQELEKQDEQKPAWSEEDNAFCNGIISRFEKELGDITLESGCNDEQVVSDLKYYYKQNINWLKSIKDRVQPKQEWIEEDIRNIENIDSVLFYDKDLSEDTCVRLRNWPKSIRPQNNITDEELAQAKKDAYNDALNKIEYHSGEPTFDDGWSAAIWYLKKRNAQPQSIWKPSDEQMEALWNVYQGGKEQAELATLYNDLNKLRKE